MDEPAPVVIYTVPAASRGTYLLVNLRLFVICVTPVFRHFNCIVQGGAWNNVLRLANTRNH